MPGYVFVTYYDDGFIFCARQTSDRHGCLHYSPCKTIGDPEVEVFSKSLYIQVRENHLEVRNVEDSRSFSGHANPGFSHSRMLVGNFTAAHACLKSLLAQARGPGFALSVAAIIHPLEKIEGGLSQVEERLFQELAVGAGASKVLVWTGATLGDAEVIARLRVV